MSYAKTFLLRIFFKLLDWKKGLVENNCGLLTFFTSFEKKTFLYQSLWSLIPVKLKQMKTRLDSNKQ